MERHRTLIVTDRPPIHQQLLLEAAPRQLDVTVLASSGRDEVLAALGDTEILVSERSGVIDRTHVEAGPNLRLIQRLGSQVHDIDLDAAPAGRNTGVFLAPSAVHDGC